MTVIVVTSVGKIYHKFTRLKKIQQDRRLEMTWGIYKFIGRQKVLSLFFRIILST